MQKFNIKYEKKNKYTKCRNREIERHECKSISITRCKNVLLKKAQYTFSKRNNVIIDNYVIIYCTFC